MTNHHCISDHLRSLRDWYRNVCPSWLKSPMALNEDGSALIEFTVMAPLLFLIVYGIIEWGSIFNIQNNMVNAARGGARIPAMQQDTTVTSTQNMTTSKQTACAWLSGTGQQFTITSADLCTGAGSIQQDVRVTISVNAAQAANVNYLGMFTGVTFNSSTQMRKDLPCTAAGVSLTCTCNATVNPPTGC